MNDTTRSAAVNPDSPAYSSQSDSAGSRNSETERHPEEALQKQAHEKNLPGAFTREAGSTNDSGGDDGRLVNGADTGADGS